MSYEPSAPVSETAVVMSAIASSVRPRLTSQRRARMLLGDAESRQVNAIMPAMVSA